jgi:hypothetical protein
MKARLSRLGVTPFGRDLDNFRPTNWLQTCSYVHWPNDRSQFGCRPGRLALARAAEGSSRLEIGKVPKNGRKNATFCRHRG